MEKPIDEMTMAGLIKTASSAIIESVSVLKDIRDALISKQSKPPRWITEGGLTFDLNEVDGIGTWHLTLYPDSPQGIRVMFKNGEKLDSTQLGKKETLASVDRINRIILPFAKRNLQSPISHDERPFE